MPDITATDARKNWFTVLKKAAKPGTFFFIRHRDIPDVVLMSKEEFEGWQETLEIMADKKLVKEIHLAEQETETVSLESIEADLAQAA